jgi:zinc transporter ZupT
MKTILTAMISAFGACLIYVAGMLEVETNNSNWILLGFLGVIIFVTSEKGIVIDEYKKWNDKSK